jgi:endonuclease YncB( thermonuclease family)
MPCGSASSCWHARKAKLWYKVMISLATLWQFTIAIELSFPVRLYGIDAPGKGQPYWREAKDFLHNLLSEIGMGE